MSYSMELSLCFHFLFVLYIALAASLRSDMNHMNRKILFQPIFSLMMLLLLFSRQPKATRESPSSQPPTHNLPPIRRKPHKLFWVCVNHIITLCVPPVSYIHTTCPSNCAFQPTTTQICTSPSKVAHNFNGLALF